MASASEPFESFSAHSLRAIRAALSPLESSLRRAAEHPRSLRPLAKPNGSEEASYDDTWERILCSAFENLVRNLRRCEHPKAERADAGKNAILIVRFARVRGGPASLVEVASAVKDSENSSHRSIVSQDSSVATISEPVESVLKSAFAGGLACAFSAALMHPVDTMKTHIQTSTLSFPQVVGKLPKIGLQGLYKGSIPAIVGQFSGHGLRMGMFEASKLILVNVAPILTEIQVQSLSSFCSTFLGTVARIPAEVLKQRLQAGLFNNIGEAIVGTWHQDGIKGFFRGTKATLLREVPFYVAGTGVYEVSKKAAQKLLRRDLEPWETILVGALSGGLTAVATTPLDVVKTRMMTAPQGLTVPMTMVAWAILHDEGPLGLYKGAVPRFFWVAPLGAMNFAGYELIRKAMDKM